MKGADRGLHPGHRLTPLSGGYRTLAPGALPSSVRSSARSLPDQVIQANARLSPLSLTSVELLGQQPIDRSVFAVAGYMNMKQCVTGPLKEVASMSEAYIPEGTMDGDGCYVVQRHE